LRRDVVVDRIELMEKVYEGDAGTDSNSVEVIVARLRRKIGHDLIETVRGRGYRLASDGA
ncbi:MAG: helix-turn-helix domain-containing protein, partial [Bradyrhizobium sp.]